jgi:bifunctional ADP-heptose synthase (sugar kinase/adenylyltransferase)
VPSVGICEGEFIGKNNAVTTTFAKPLLSNFIYNLPNYQIVSAGPETVKDVNYLLDAGNFKLSGAMNVRNNMSSCLQPGYLIREDQANCAADDCKATATSALLVRIVESAQPKKDYIVARKTQLQGFDGNQKENLYSVNAHEQFLAEIPELAKKVSEK